MKNILLTYYFQILLCAEPSAPEYPQTDKFIEYQQRNPPPYSPVEKKVKRRAPQPPGISRSTQTDEEFSQPKQKSIEKAIANKEKKKKSNANLYLNISLIFMLVTITILFAYLK